MTIETARWCKARVDDTRARAAAETDPKRRRYFEAEAASWRVEQLFYEAVCGERA